MLDWGPASVVHPNDIKRSSDRVKASFIHY